MPDVVRRWIIGIENRKHSMRFVVLFLIFISPALAYLGVVFNGGNTLLFEDGLLAQFPFRVFIHNSFIHGFSPQWMPYSACGISLLAEGQSGICFPGTQIIYRIFPAEIGWIIEIILAQLVAFTFSYFLFQHLRISRMGSLFGASVYTFCTIAFSLTGVPAMMWCYSLLPGVFLCCDHFVEGRPFSFVYLSAILALVFLTGHPVMMVYIGMIISVFFVVHLMAGWQKETSIRKIGPRFLALLGTVLLAAFIASPQLLPIIHEIPFSARTVGASMSLEDLQNTIHLQPIWMFLSLFPTPPQWGEWEFLSSAIRFPFYALFLAFIGLLYGEKGPRHGCFIFLCLFSILMALGPYVGLWQFVHSLPGLKHLRFPYRWLIFLPICVAFFSARGIDHLFNLPGGLPRPELRRLLKSLLIIGVAIEITFIVFYRGKLLQQIHKALESSPWLTGLLWLCAIGMVLAVFLSLTKSAARYGVVSGVILTVISLFATLAFNIQDPKVIRKLGMIGWGGNTQSEEPQAYRTSSTVSPYEVWLSNTIEHHNQYTPNLTLLNGTLSTGHYFSFFPYWSANVSGWCQDALKGDHKKQVYLNLCSSKWLFMPEGPPSGRPAFPENSFKGLKAYKNPGAMPRATVVFSYRLFADEGHLLAFLESPDDFDPRRELTILKQDAEAWNLQSDTQEPGAATIPIETAIVLDRPDRIELQLKSAPPKGAFLVLSDTFYPGWRALVDGVETKVLRTTYAFRGIKLPEGAENVVFFFERA
ncbi:MAG: YfhO family protein [Desulfobulbaceae bacterium]|nr:YfhO family protein [Desulfobulbaceae bacterium]